MAELQSLATGCRVHMQRACCQAMSDLLVEVLALPGQVLASTTAVQGCAPGPEPRAALCSPTPCKMAPVICRQRTCIWRWWCSPACEQPGSYTLLVNDAKLPRKHSRNQAQDCWSPAGGSAVGSLPASGLDRIQCWSMMGNGPKPPLGIKPRAAAHLLVEVLALPCLLAAECTHLLQHGVGPSQL